MGSSSSYELPDVALVPLGKPVAAVSVRFCTQESLTLQQNVSALLSKLTFRNVDTDAVRFTAKRSLSNRVRLFDGSDVAIVNAKSKTFSTKPIYYVHLGSEHDGDATLEIHVRYRISDKTEVRVAFTNLVTHERCELSFDGHWRKRAAYFWLERGTSSVRTPVAKVFCLDGVSRNKYHVAIAPNMDTALITIACAILSSQQLDEEMAAASM